MSQGDEATSNKPQTLPYSVLQMQSRTSNNLVWFFLNGNRSFPEALFEYLTFCFS